MKMAWRQRAWNGLGKADYGKGRPKSAETKLKISIAMRGRKQSPAAVAANSAGHMGKKPSDETRKKLSDKAAASYASDPNHPLKRGLNRGWHHTVEAKAQMSRVNKGRQACHAKRVAYNGSMFRSTWEAAVARELDRRAIEWQYEPRSFFCGDGSRYTPDFYLPSIGAYWEVKGLFTKVSAYKIAEFRRLQVEPLVVLNGSVVAMFCRDWREQGLDLRSRFTFSDCLA